MQAQIAGHCPALPSALHRARHRRAHERHDVPATCKHSRAEHSAQSSLGTQPADARDAERRSWTWAGVRCAQNGAQIAARPPDGAVELTQAAELAPLHSLDANELASSTSTAGAVSLRAGEAEAGAAQLAHAEQSAGVVQAQQGSVRAGNGAAVQPDGASAADADGARTSGEGASKRPRVPAHNGLLQRRPGERLVVSESSLSEPDIQALLQSLLDDPALVRLRVCSKDAGEPIEEVAPRLRQAAVQRGLHWCASMLCCAALYSCSARRARGPIVAGGMTCLRAILCFQPIMC